MLPLASRRSRLLRGDNPGMACPELVRLDVHQQEGRHMAQLKNPYDKDTIKYFFANSRDLGMEWRQSNIENRVIYALNKWLPHCGLNATRLESADGANLIFKWGHVPNDEAGRLVGGRADGQEMTMNRVATVTFNDDVDWTGGQMSFFIVAAHEIGHALGLDHSAAEKSVMHDEYETGWHTRLAGSEDIFMDDVVGVRTLYRQPPYIEHPDYVLAARVLAILNWTEEPLEYWVYNDHDDNMWSSHQKDTLPKHELTYYKNDYNFNQDYRVYGRVRGKDGPYAIAHGVSRSGQAIFRLRGDQLSATTNNDNWGLPPPSQ
jgi:hypothetical protein